MKTKEQKLAQVDELVRKLGLTRGEVVNYLNKLLLTEKMEAPKIRGDIAKTTKSVKQNEIFNDIANYLKNKYNENHVNGDYELSNHLGFDELDFEEFRLFLGQKYSINIPEKIAIRWKTINDAIKFVQSLTSN